MQHTDHSPGDDNMTGPTQHTPAEPPPSSPKPKARCLDPRAHMRGDGLHASTPSSKPLNAE
jgi:hypothetical protein